MFCSAMLDTYWEWEKGYYELVNVKKSQVIWVCNGMMSLTLNRHYLPLSDKMYLHNKLKEHFAKQVLDPDNRYSSAGCMNTTS